MYKDLALKTCQYFDKKAAEGHLTAEEQALYSQALACKDIYPVTCVTKDDLVSAGLKADNVSRQEMQMLASKMGDDYVEQLFWIHLPIIAGNLGIK